MESLRAQLTLEHAKDVKRLEAQLAKDACKIEELQQAKREADRLRKDASKRLPPFVASYLSLLLLRVQLMLTCCCARYRSSHRARSSAKKRGGPSSSSHPCDHSR